MSQEHTFTTSIGGHTITVSTGKLAPQAGGAVTLRIGDCLLLSTATMSRNRREGMNFFPLSVDYEEKLYAAGRIPGSFFKREGRPSTNAILTARLTDRPLRPLFPDGMRNDVQVITTALSSDGVHLLDIPSVNAASAALHISDVPWNGPIAAVRVGLVDGQFVANPTIEVMAQSTLDLRIAGSRDAIIMVEAGADEVPEDVMVDALAFGHEAMQPMIDLQEEMRAAVGKPKATVELITADESLAARVAERAGDRAIALVHTLPDRHERREAIAALVEEVTEAFVAEEPDVDKSEIGDAIRNIVKKEIRRRILEEQVRPDGRDPVTVRALSAEVGLSPRAHGSGLFQRGETQVLSIATLGMLGEAQRLDGLEPEDTRRFLHHYNFPPFSTGETWPLRSPKRREIGHGALAERAIEPMIPDEETFPYTIRVVSEVLSSNGSTSQASICATSLALMDCGVPLKKAVAGVAMGLVYDGASDNYQVLTDIQGEEDHLGDMDFKVAGTRDGITAMQMDIKIEGLSMALMRNALSQAYAGRMTILDAMDQALAQPREELNPNAPRMYTMKIDTNQIGTVIGKGGATVRGIQDEYDVKVDIAEDGTVFVAGVVGEKVKQAMELIEMLTRGADLGEIYTGKVTRITDYGCFVELIPGIEGMVHISQLSRQRVPTVDSVVQVGDEIMVMVTNVDTDTGKVRLSRRAVLEEWTLEEAQANDRPSGGGGGRRRNGRGRR